MPTAQAETINADLLALLQGVTKGLRNINVCKADADIL
jgi:hypothetical protein